MRKIKIPQRIFYSQSSCFSKYSLLPWGLKLDECHCQLNHCVISIILFTYLSFLSCMTQPTEREMENLKRWVLSTNPTLPFLRHSFRREDLFLLTPGTTKEGVGKAQRLAGPVKQMTCQRVHWHSGSSILLSVAPMQALPRVCPALVSLVPGWFLHYVRKISLYPSPTN